MQSSNGAMFHFHVGERVSVDSDVDRLIFSHPMWIHTDMFDNPGREAHLSTVKWYDTS